MQLKLLINLMPSGLNTTTMPVQNENLPDDAAFEVLFRAYFTPLCAYCQYKFDFGLDMAKEAVHSGFLKLWENRSSLTTGPSVKAYLYKIVTNICIDMLRHEKVQQKHAGAISYQMPAFTGNDAFNRQNLAQLTADIDKAVAALPEQMRRVFELSRYEGLKYSEISACLNISVKTVETQMSRALMKLRQQLAPYLTTATMVILLGI